MAGLISQSELDALPVVRFPEVAANAPARYSAVQNFMMPHADAIHTGWWIVLALTVCVLVYRNFLTRSGRSGYCMPVCELVVAGAKPPPQDPVWAQRYLAFFGFDELKKDIALRWFAGAVILGFIVTFNGWMNDPALNMESIKNFNVQCWPFFQSCADWIIFPSKWDSYAQSNFFMLLFTLLVVAAYAVISQRYFLAHLCLLLCFAAKLYFMLINYRFNGNYDYYHTMFTFILLFMPHKRFFGSLSIVAFYCLSTVAKIHPSWTFGGYFIPLKLGLPIFPDELIVPLTNLVIVMEMVMAWFMFSRNRLLQRGVFLFFCLFHIYSGTLVGYHYPLIVMPSLMIFFGPLFTHFGGIPFDRRAILGWLSIAGLCAVQMIPILIPGDSKLTLEGNFYGLYMFEANHQCRYDIIDNETGERMFRRRMANARNRCDPWRYLTRSQQRYCNQPGDSTYSYHMIHSINGGPFYEIVRESDLCSLRYKAFGRNHWIKDEKTAPKVGRPVENFML